MTAFFRDRRSSWLACVALAFPCGPVWFRSKERGGRVKDRAKNRASNCFETTQKRLLRRLLVAERRLLRQYQNHLFLGTWFRLWLQFSRSSHQDNFENFWEVVLPVQTPQIRYVDLFDGPRRLSIHTAWNASLSFTIVSSQFTPRLLFSFFVFSD